MSKNTMGASIKVDVAALNLGQRINKKMLSVVLPRALQKAGRVVAVALRSRLPDGVKSGTRAKQTGAGGQWVDADRWQGGRWASRTNIAARFPEHMRDNVVQKLGASDTTGTLQLVGVSGRAKHVRFDFGDKAKKGVGRRHLLWSPKGKEPPVVHTPEYRRQKQDIVAEVTLLAGPRAADIVIREIRKAVDSGELK